MNKVLSMSLPYLNPDIANKCVSGYVRGKLYLARERFWLSQCPTRKDYVAWSKKYTESTTQKMHEHVKKHGYMTYRVMTQLEEEECEKNNFLWNCHLGGSYDSD